jgi:hypothetical protein
MNGARWPYESCQIRRHFLIIICFVGVGTIAWTACYLCHSSPDPNCDLHSGENHPILDGSGSGSEGIPVLPRAIYSFLLVAVLSSLIRTYMCATFTE